MEEMEDEARRILKGGFGFEAGTEKRWAVRGWREVRDQHVYWV